MSKLRWDRAHRNSYGYEPATPRTWNAAEASARQMARLLGKEPKPSETRRRRTSREQFEETRRLIERPHVHRAGAFVRLQYGQVVETGFLTLDEIVGEGRR